jgi:two-component system, NarL family, sensor histidine kinase UhpB
MATTDLRRGLESKSAASQVGALARARLMTRLLRPASLFWRVFLVNASLVTAAVVLLALTPLTIKKPTSLHQLALLALGLGVWLVANALLLRISLRPLQRLTQLMQQIDLLRPGGRLAVAGARELNVVLSTFNDMLERLERERRMSSSRSVGREEEERRRLASELHDQVGQGLTALLLQLKTVLVDAPEPLRAGLVEAQAIARGNLDEVRRIARRLRPTVLDDLGLPYALLALADAAEEQADLLVVRRVDASAPHVSQSAELVLYRIAQEALTNILRHADASRMELVLEASEDGDRVQLTIHDNGRGMLFAGDVERGGIRGMRERALAADAQLSITTRPGGGTSVIVSVPVQR